MGNVSEKFFCGEYYHIYNRGVDKRSIFIDEADYFRFILGMVGFNDSNPIFNLRRIKDNKKGELKTNQQPLLKIICYSLMPNHYHLLVCQLEENGVSKFMQKLGAGYTKYFNKRYDRTGVLFQGVFKTKRISSDEYLLHLSRYIHLNALSLLQPHWLKDGIKDKLTADKFLKEYKWHSLPFWLKIKACLIRLYPEIILNQFNAIEDYEKFITLWLIDDFDKIKNIALEA